jgi:hypothetical protein
MGLIPYNFIPEYSIKKINNLQYLIAKKTAQSPPFSVL